MKRTSATVLIFFMLVSAVIPSVYSQPPDETSLKTASINGYQLHFLDKGAGPVVILVHGALGDYRTWSGQVAALARHYRVISYSRRYFYPNEWKGDSVDFSTTPHAEDLSALIKYLGVQRAHLIGHSSGAMVVLKTAIDHPDQVQSLTLAEPPLLAALPPTDRSKQLVNDFVSAAFPPSIAAFAAKDTVRAVYNFIDVVMGVRGYLDKIGEPIRSIMLQNARELKGHMSTPNVLPPYTCTDLKQLKMPVLLVEGSRSLPLFLDCVAEAHRCIPGSTVRRLEGVSHGLELEDAAAFSKVVLAFLQMVPLSPK